MPLIANQMQKKIKLIKLKDANVLLSPYFSEISKFYSRLCLVSMIILEDFAKKTLKNSKNFWWWRRNATSSKWRKKTKIKKWNIFLSCDIFIRKGFAMQWSSSWFFMVIWHNLKRIFFFKLMPSYMILVHERNFYKNINCFWKHKDTSKLS